MNPVQMTVGTRMACIIFTFICILFYVMPPFGNPDTDLKETIEQPEIVHGAMGMPKIEQEQPRALAEPVVMKNEKYSDPPAHAPDEFTFHFTTTKGVIEMQSTKKDSPLGVEQLYQMIKAGFFDAGPLGGIGIFRTVPDFVLQFGIHGDPKIQRIWSQRVIKDDPLTVTNAKGTLTFATSGKDTRTTQLFLNLKANGFLDKMGFTPIAKCVQGCEIMEKIEMKYREKPNQGLIQQQGNEYLKKEFPDMDYIIKASLKLH